MKSILSGRGPLKRQDLEYPDAFGMDSGLYYIFLSSSEMTQDFFMEQQR
jgi:hypothetical protein